MASGLSQKPSPVIRNSFSLHKSWNMLHAVVSIMVMRLLVPSQVLCYTTQFSLHFHLYSNSAATWIYMHEAELVMDRRWVLLSRILSRHKWYHCFHHVQHLHLYYSRHLYYGPLRDMHQFHCFRPVLLLLLLLLRPPFSTWLMVAMGLTMQPPRHNLSRNLQQNQAYRRFLACRQQNVRKHVRPLLQQDYRWPSKAM